MSFNFNNNSMANSANFAESIFGDFFPNGRSPVLNTSRSISPPMVGQTLSARTVSDVISGDTIFRSPKYALASLNRSVSSSLNDLITGGASAAAAGTPENPVLTIENPEATDFSVNDDGKASDKNNATLTGNAAFNRILAGSIAGKNLGNTFVDSAIQFVRNTQIKTSEESTLAGGAGGSGTNPTQGGIAEMQSAGRRDVALIADLTEEEKGWYQERLSLLKSYYGETIHDYSTLGGFRFDIPNEWADDPRPVYGAGYTYFPDAQVEDSERITSDELIKQNPAAGISNAFLSAALIELLILLHEKNIVITGGTGAGRDPNDPRYVKEDKFALSDHTYGRAIDIESIGKLNQQSYNVDQNRNKETHKACLDILFEALSEVPQYLLPDSIGTHDGLAQEYGIETGLEPMTAPFKVNRPNLQYVDVFANDKHRDHIHLSFSGMRAGKYVGPGGAMTIAGTNVVDSAPSGGTTLTPEQIRLLTEAGIPFITQNSNLDKNYYKDWGYNLGIDGIYDVLTQTWCTPEVAAILSAISWRESRYGATSFYVGSTDFISLGILQINMKVGAHGSKSYELTDANGKQTLLGWQIAVANWDSVFPGEPKPTQDTYNKVIQEKYNLLKFYNGGSENKTFEIMRELVDKRVWIPRNQAWLAYGARTGNLPTFGLQPLGGYQFQVWGDGYKDYGWMNGGVKFSDATDVYTRKTGKSADDLKKWVKNVYTTDPSVFRPEVANYSGKYINRWLDGEVFPS